MTDIDAKVAFSTRFRKVANRYPRRVTEAYRGKGLHPHSAMAQSDATVAANVAQWERDQGMQPVDWIAIGREEGR